MMMTSLKVVIPAFVGMKIEVVILTFYIIIIFNFFLLKT